ncbi:hypothetical protein GCM10009836_27020 [Pseudonocardia ailaonensis]|uniref:Uncharacterized protein n=1 Tax=Pseudonocardia ailaonensis TaxID=367279 RepID=A0ABN2N2S3_9PSEU
MLSRGWAGSDSTTPNPWTLNALDCSVNVSAPNGATTVPAAGWASWGWNGPTRVFVPEPSVAKTLSIRQSRKLQFFRTKVFVPPMACS